MEQTGRLLIRGAYVIDPSQGIEEQLDLLAEDGIITRLEPRIDCPMPALSADGGGRISRSEPDADYRTLTVIDAQGLYLTPGLADMHVHLRDPGYLHKEDITTGCAAAAAGGFTAVACMPNTNPVCDSESVVRYILEKAALCKTKVYPVAAITHGLGGAILTDFAALKAAGAVAVSDDGRPVSDSRVMLSALIAAKKAGLPLISHAEELSLAGGGIINEGTISAALRVEGISPAAEDAAVARELALAAYADTPIHIAHVSTKGAVALIRDAKARGVPVTCETAPHYLLMTEQALLTRNADYRMNPPLRTEADKQALLEGIIDGTVDVIATDHAPHSVFEKSDFERSPNGVIGLETSLAACLTALVHTGRITLSRLVDMMSTKPCAILGRPGGTLRIGSIADLTLFDINRRWTVNKNRFYSKSRNTPFDRVDLLGRVQVTIQAGEPVYIDTTEKECS